MGDRPFVLISPKVPPAHDGVGDYTYRLAAELAKRQPVAIITTEGQSTSNRSCRVLTVPDWGSRGMAALWPLLEELQPSFINVQWVPFLWGRWGVNIALPIAALRLRHAGYRVVTTVHEPYVPFDMWRRLPMGVIQRLELWALMSGSEKVAVSISEWTRMFQARFFWRQDDIFWLPVGSNIPRVSQSAEERAALRRSLGIGAQDLVAVLFNPLGAGKMLARSYAAWAAIRRVQPEAKLLVIGCELNQLSPAPPAAADVICTGYADPERASQLLSAADLCLAAYVDGMSARRGAAIAALEHGLPTISTTGHLTDHELFDGSPLALSPVGDELAFVEAAARLAGDEAARRALHAPTVEFYQRHFSWPVIAATLMQQCAAVA